MIPHVCLVSTLALRPHPSTGEVWMHEKLVPWRVTTRKAACNVSVIQYEACEVKRRKKKETETTSQKMYIHDTGQALLCN